MVSCEEQRSFAAPTARYEFRFVNETEHDVEYFASRFEIPSGKERIHEIYAGVSEVPVKSISEACFRGVYDRHYWVHAYPEDSVALIRFDDDRCLFYKSDQIEGPQDLQNFERTGDLQFTYRIDQELYETAVPCAVFEFRFVNETEHDVEYFGHMFEIPAGEERSREELTYVKELPPQSGSQYCLKSIYKRHYWFHAYPEYSVALIQFDDDRCLFYKSDQIEGPQDLQNFEQTLIHEGHLQLTYRVDQELYETAVPCAIF